MTPEKYCYQKAAPPTSALYYSLRKLELQQRDAVVAIYAFYKELEDILFECNDLQVAQAKFNWWCQELIKPKPDHPAAIVLQKIIPQFSLPVLKFIEMIDGVEQSLSFATFVDFSEVVVHWMRTAGVRELLIADVLQKKERVSPETIYQFMLVIELVNYIQHLRAYVQRGLIYFSEDELKQFQVTPLSLRQSKTTPEIRNLLQFQAEKILRAYGTAKSALTPQSKSELMNFIARSEIALQTLKQIQADNFCVLENFIDLTPLKKWWIVWW